MGKDTFKYIGTCMLIYLMLAVSGFFLLDPLIDFVFTGFWKHLYVHLFLLLLIDPLLTYRLAGRIHWTQNENNGDDLL